MPVEPVLQVKDWQLATAEILYRLPDHPLVLQSYVWQDFDEAPHYPALRRFLAFWRRELAAELHSVRLGSRRLLAGIAPDPRAGAVMLH